MSKLIPNSSSSGPLLPDGANLQTVSVLPLAAVSYPPQAPASEEGFNLKQLLTVIRRRWRLITAVGLVVTASVWVKTLLETPIYEGGFQLLIESKESSQPNLAGIGLSEEAQSLTRSDTDFQTLVNLLRSPALLEPIAQQLRFQLPELSVAELQSNLTVSQLRNSQILEVRYRDPNPQIAQRITQALAQYYLDYSLTQEQVRLTKGIEFLDQQFPNLQQQVSALEGQIARFRQTYKFVDPEGQGTTLVGSLNDLDNQLRLTQVELSKQQALYQQLQQQLGVSPSQAIASSVLSESPRYQSLLTEALELDKKIALESARLQPDNPVLLALREKRKQLDPLLRQEANKLQQGRNSSNQVLGQMTALPLALTKQLVETSNQLEVLQRQQAALQNNRAQLARQFELYPELARTYTALQRQLTVADTNLKNFLAARENLRLEAAQRVVPWELISPATVGGSPVSPNIPRNFALGLFLGAIAGVGAGLLRDRLDHVFHSPQEVKVDLDVPLLASVPYIEEPLGALRGLATAALPEQSTTAELPAAGYRYGSRHHEEAFRSLYTNLRFLGADTPIRSLALGSSIPNEGKSTVAALLARTVSQMGQRVLLIDADLRKPQVHSRLGIENLRGLSNLLSSPIDLDVVIQPVAENFDAITAGPRPPDPTKLLSSQRMTQLAEYLKTCGRYDLVIYDTPPLLGMADTKAFAKAIDGIILVVSLGRVDRDAPKEVIQQLKFAEIPLLGLVTNSLSPETTPKGQSYSYYYYYQGYGEPAASLTGGESSDVKTTQVLWRRLQRLWQRL
ncbi:GumC family protein [Synechococcus elongatus]|uniref:non-specific protein-tyrosine kinase n=1 Tax=Synechococcus elongatus PCC 11802 TaxID=2283154 RepID=A0AAU6R5H9_SYNEL